MKKLLEIYVGATDSKLLKLIIIAVTLDMIFGFLRYVKEKKFNSNFGINGGIRKIGMIISLIALVLVDYILAVNFIGFIPDSIRVYMQKYLGFSYVGIVDIFSLLYLAYEIASILKNMCLCGLPVKGLQEKIIKILKKYTDELPSDY